MGERYHLGGRVATDTVAMAAARQEQAGIQRRHRLERRHGDDPSQEPAANVGSIPPQPFLHNWKPAVNGKLTAILVQREFSTAGGGAPLKGTIPQLRLD